MIPINKKTKMVRYKIFIQELSDKDFKRWSDVMSWGPYVGGIPDDVKTEAVKQFFECSELSNEHRRRIKTEMVETF